MLFLASLIGQSFRCSSEEAAARALRDEITHSHARWAEANERVLLLSGMPGAVDARYAAEEARTRATEHYRQLVGRLTRSA